MKQKYVPKKECRNKNADNKLLESLNEQLDKALLKRRQATIMVTDLANQIEEEEKRAKAHKILKIKTSIRPAR